MVHTRRVAIEWTDAECRLREVHVQGEAAWPVLQQVRTRELLRMARLRPIGRWRNDIDAASEVAVSVLARLRANDFRAMRAR